MGVRRTILPPVQKRVQPDVSLAIVNIVLLLILFFLATGALVNTPDQGVRLSETIDLPIDQLPSPVLVVEENGDLVLDGEPVQRAALSRALVGQGILHILINKTAAAHDLLALIEQPGLEQLDIRLVTIHRRGGS